MKIIKPKIIIESQELNPNKLKAIEKSARICYKSESKDNINRKFLGNLIRGGHESVIEHKGMTVLFVTDRGISHEIVRHRTGKFSQESSRYCNYANDKFGNEITVIEPICLNEKCFNKWLSSCLVAEYNYFGILKDGSTPQQARSVLPTCLKTELYMTMDFRNLRNFLKLRVDKSAHPDVRRLAIPLLILLKANFYPLFDDIEIPIDMDIKDYADIVILEEDGNETVLSTEYYKECFNE